MNDTLRPIQSYKRKRWITGLPYSICTNLLVNLDYVCVWEQGSPDRVVTSKQVTEICQKSSTVYSSNAPCYASVAVLVCCWHRTSQPMKGAASGMTLRLEPIAHDISDHLDQLWVLSAHAVLPCHCDRQQAATGCESHMQRLSAQMAQ